MMAMVFGELVGRVSSYSRGFYVYSLLSNHWFLLSFLSFFYPLLFTLSRVAKNKQCASPLRYHAKSYTLVIHSACYGVSLFYRSCLFRRNCLL
ncbi:hypothetical protein F5Y16DRAFT_219186 [Xylariaceae sp. FL0255]|nr:hypothetical protein F5Y16DRAFT_219186 [Xylariaceae sp. FL0255]